MRLNGTRFWGPNDEHKFALALSQWWNDVIHPPTAAHKYLFQVHVVIYPDGEWSVGMTGGPAEDGHSVVIFTGSEDLYRWSSGDEFALYLLRVLGLRG